VARRVRIRKVDPRIHQATDIFDRQVSLSAARYPMRKLEFIQRGRCVPEVGRARPIPLARPLVERKSAARTPEKSTNRIVD
jgi:hypothetical protein